MSSTRASAGAILSPEQVGQLVVQPLSQASVALAVSNVVTITGQSLRIPVLSGDSQASWTAEGGEINVTDPTLTEINLTPKKLAALTVLSNELAADSSPAALGVVGESIVRDLQRKIDAAYFGDTVANGPDGLLSTTPSTVGAGADWSDFDWAEEAKSNAEQRNSVVGAFVCSPATAVNLMTLKRFDTAGSNVPILQPVADPNGEVRRVVAGVPLLTSPAIDDHLVWAIPVARSVVALRSDVEVIADTSAYFSSDRTAVRATLRLDFGFPDELAISQITTENYEGGSS